MDDRKYSPFQLKIISLFEEEIILRLNETNSKIHSEAEVMKVVDECYEELFVAQTDIETGAIDVCRRPEGENVH